MTTQIGVLVECVFAGLTGVAKTGSMFNGLPLEHGRVIFAPASGEQQYKEIYASPVASPSVLLDQSAIANGGGFTLGGIRLDSSGSAKVYAVGHYFCEAYDSNNVLQRQFHLRYGSVTGDPGGGSGLATRILDIRGDYGTDIASVNSAITHANSNSSTKFVFLFKDATFTLANNMVFPANVTVRVEPTAYLKIPYGTDSVTIHGGIHAGLHQIFKYDSNNTGVITLNPYYTDVVYPQWFGAIPDGTTNTQFEMDRALKTGVKRMVLTGGTFLISVNLTIPSDVEIIRQGGADFSTTVGITISGLGGQATVFDKVQSDGSLITNLNASNILTGTLDDARLSGPVTKQGNEFNGANQLVKLDANQKLPAKDGSQITSLNASNVSSGTVNDDRLSNNITKKGNVFNGASQLVELDSSQRFPAKNASLVTNINGTNVSSGTVADARLSNNITKKGNSFNGVNQLVQLDSSQRFPAKNASLVTDINGSKVSSGTVADARLSSNVTKKGNSFNGASQLVQLDSSQRFPAKNASLVTDINGSNVSSGTVADARLSANVTKQGNSFNGANQLVNLDASQRATIPGGIDAGGNGTFLKTKVFEIGGWNMMGTTETTTTKEITTGVLGNKIREVNVLITNDAGTYIDKIDVIDYRGSTGLYESGQYRIRENGNIILFAYKNGRFRYSYQQNFTNSSINRGWVKISYEP